MAKLYKVCFKINFFGIDRKQKQLLFKEVRNYIDENYPNDVCFVDIDRPQINATIVMRTTKDIRQDIVDKFDLRYTGNRFNGWIA